MTSVRAPGPRARTTVVLGIAFILERLDESILGAVYTPLGKALHASPSQLGTLTLCRALVQVASNHSYRLLISLDLPCVGMPLVLFLFDCVFAKPKHAQRQMSGRD